MNGLRLLLLAFFARLLASELFAEESRMVDCNPEECENLDSDDYDFNDHVKCCRHIIGDGWFSTLSKFYVFINESTPKLSIPLRRLPEEHARCSDLNQRVRFFSGSTSPDRATWSAGCKEPPVIELGTKSCYMQVTWGCAGHGDRFSKCNASDPPLDKYALLNGAPRLSSTYWYGIDPYYGNFLDYVGSDERVPCDFDPDKDNLLLDFYVELKNKPGCLVSFEVEGCPGWIPIKTNATSLG